MSIDLSKYEGHTPGEWKWVKVRTLQHLHDSSGSCFAQISMPITSYDSYQANARLIADAPVLLNEVKRLKEVNENIKRQAEYVNKHSLNKDIEITKVRAERDALKEAVEAALRISELWMPPDEVLPQHAGEAATLAQMYERLKAALKKRAGLKSGDAG
jgi:hypothetical protein